VIAKVARRTVEENLMAIRVITYCDKCGGDKSYLESYLVNLAINRVKIYAIFEGYLGRPFQPTKTFQLFSLKHAQTSLLVFLESSSLLNETFLFSSLYLFILIPTAYYLALSLILY
jgi:hypothetical protein